MNTKRVIIRSLVLGICFLAYSFNAVANDAIEFTWKGDTSKKFTIQATAGESFTVYWGDGTNNIYTGAGYNDIKPSHIYADTNNYTVTIVATTANGQFTYLDCSSNSLSSMDVSKSTALIYLRCFSNSLSSLDVSKNTALETLGCSVNKLTSLDVSKNTTLKHLGCYSNNLSSLDVSKNTALEYLYCYSNNLSSLDVSKNTALVALDCDNNSLNNLNVSNCTALFRLWCYNNHLPLSNLYEISKTWTNYYTYNLLLGQQTLPLQTVTTGEIVDFSLQAKFGNPDTLTVFTITKNGSPAPPSDYSIINGRVFFNTIGAYQITMTNAAIVSSTSYPAKVIVDINVVYDTICFTWNADTNLYKDFRIYAYNVGNFTVNWGDGADSSYTSGGTLNHTYAASGTYTVTITTTAANNYHFTRFDCYDRQVINLDVSKCTALRELDCGTNLLNNLDVSKNTNLRYLNCLNNQLKKLDVSRNMNLTDIYCDNNLLENLDVSKNAMLGSLTCSSNNLNSLDVSKNTALINLSCSFNSLSSLDLSNCMSLDYLDCSSNSLNSLDVSKNTMLRNLNCVLNNLNSLDVSKNTALEYLYCSFNSLNSLDVSKNTALDGVVCESNHLQLSDLFLASEIIKDPYKKHLGTQTLKPQTLDVGDAVDFSSQDVFNHIFTKYEITKNYNPAEITDFSINNGIITFHTAGFYIVTMTNAAIFTSPHGSPAQVIAEFNVGGVGIVEAGSAHPIQIYPNPTSGKLIIESQKSKVESVEIYDIVGRKLSTFNFQFPTNAIDISHLANGMYFLKVDGKVYKIIKE